MWSNWEDLWFHGKLKTNNNLKLELEAEYRSLTSINMAELVMLKGLDVEIQLPYSDHSKSPIHLVANLVYHKRT